MEGEIKLTTKELEICKLLADGLTAKQIAIQLKISYRTVERHIYGIKIKTGITSVARLTYFYLTQIVGIFNPALVQR